MYFLHGLFFSRFFNCMPPPPPPPPLLTTMSHREKKNCEKKKGGSYYRCVGEADIEMEPIPMTAKKPWSSLIFLFFLYCLNNMVQLCCNCLKG